MGGQFAALTFLTPFLQQVTGISGGLISVFLLAYGVAKRVGKFAGGWAGTERAAHAGRRERGADRRSRGALQSRRMPIVVAPALVVWAWSASDLFRRCSTGRQPGRTWRDFAATLPASAVTLASPSVPSSWLGTGRHGAKGAVIAGLIICASPCRSRGGPGC